jgi:hypothetical protein
MSVLRETATIDWGNSLLCRVTGFWRRRSVEWKIGNTVSQEGVAYTNK